MTEKLHAALITATAAAADAALDPNSGPMRQKVANLLAQAALYVLEEAAPTGDNVLSIA